MRGTWTADDRWDGEERCGFCHERYVFELEIHCVDCDRPICPLCTVHERVRAERICPECIAGARDADLADEVDA